MTDTESHAETDAPVGDAARAGEPAGHDSLLEFVEQFALVMHEGGVPRMPARVFAYVLAEDADRYTARELADGLQVSPAAISGAVRYLVQAGLLIKDRLPGARADHYRIDDEDVWATIFAQRLPQLQRWDDQLSKGVVLFDGTRGGDRLRETQAYIRFMQEEFTRMLEVWPRRKRELLARLGDGPGA